MNDIGFSTFLRFLKLFRRFSLQNRSKYCVNQVFKNAYNFADGGHFPLFRHDMVYRDKVDSSHGILYHIHISANENVEVSTIKMDVYAI